MILLFIRSIEISAHQYQQHYDQKTILAKKKPQTGGFFRAEYGHRRVFDQMNSELISSYFCISRIITPKSQVSVP